MMVGGTHEIMPTPRPWITTVAGPVMPRSLIEMTGPKSNDVKYSVNLPMMMPASRPTAHNGARSSSLAFRTPDLCDPNNLGLGGKRKG
eukprot:5818034-Prymnesium_polylepis.1